VVVWQAEQLHDLLEGGAWRDDRFAAIKSDYEQRGRDPSNLRYGFVVPT
jgi:hypothetical protein